MPERYHESLRRLHIMIAVSMVLGALAILISLQLNNRQELLTNRHNGLVNQTYVRTTNCFLAVPADQRTAQWINSCYNRAEKSTGMKVERYDTN